MFRGTSELGIGNPASLSRCLVGSGRFLYSLMILLRRAMGPCTRFCVSSVCGRRFAKALTSERFLTTKLGILQHSSRPLTSKGRGHSTALISIHNRSDCDIHSCNTNKGSNSDGGKTQYCLEPLMSPGMCTLNGMVLVAQPKTSSAER